MLCAMPELPEVERGRRIATRIAVGRRIADVRCADDPILLQLASFLKCAYSSMGLEAEGAINWNDLAGLIESSL